MNKSLSWNFRMSWLKLQPTPKCVVVAFSGGTDSTVLVDLLQHLPREERPLLYLAYFNHQLRTDSRIEEEKVRQFAKEQHLELIVNRWEQPHGESEAEAHHARYSFLAQALIKTGSKTLVTAHHGDDLAETILFRIVRSGNVTELPGLQFCRDFGTGQVVRPLLAFSKDELQNYAQIQQISGIEDYTNQTDFTARNRIRHYVLPQLKNENAKMITHVNRFSDEIQALEQLAQIQYQQIQKQMAIRVCPERISGEFPDIELSNVAWKLFWQDFLLKYLPDLPMPSMGQLTQLAELSMTLSGHHQLSLQDDWVFNQSYREFIFVKRTKDSKSRKIKTKQVSYKCVLNQWTKVDDGEIGIFDHQPPTNPGQTVAISLNAIPLLFELRHYQAGDRVLLGDGSHQLLRRRFVNNKIPQTTRNKQWVLIVDKEIIWVQNIYHYKLFNASETAKIIYVSWRSTAIKNS